MTRRSRVLIVASICGSLLGAALVSNAYKTQGGIGLTFAIVGAVIGGIAGYFTITRQLRMHILGAAIGSIAALTLFQVPVCDGSHYGMPVLGGLIGMMFGGLFESFLKSKIARVDPKTDADTVQSTNKAMHTKPSIGRF
jgi:drug/metabolite transporter (DMT)-like permease